MKPYRRTRLVLGAAPQLLLMLGSITANAKETSVSPGSLAQAVAQAAEGDTLLLQPGVYYERVEISKPLALLGLPGAVLDGSVPLAAEWSPAGGDLENVYVAPVKDRPRGLLVGGKFVAAIRYDRAQSKGDWNWRTLLRRGPPLSGFEQIRALWMHHPEEQRIYARFENGAKPDDLKLSVVTSADPLLRITNTKHVTVEGIDFAGAVVAFSLGNGAADCTVSRCKVTSFEKTGISLVGGATRCTVEDCDITRGSVEEWSPSIPSSRANYEIWRIHKDVGDYDRNGISLVKAGVNNRVLRNHLHRVFDGVALGDSSAESLDIPLPDPDHCRGAEIAGNLIEETRDSGIELGVGCIDVDVHHNILRRTHGGLRFKLPRIGPIYIHHNRLIDGAPFGIWFSMDASPAEAYVYHNTILRGGDEALQVARAAMRRDFIAPRWHFVNNLVLSDEGFCQPSSKLPLDFTASHNVTTGTQRPWPEDSSKDVGSKYGVTIAHDDQGKPQPGSAAQDAGLDLSAYRGGKALPGCPGGYFRGAAPDAGADEQE